MRTNFDEMASNVSDGVVTLTEKDVTGATFMHSAIENYRRRVYASLTMMVGVARNKKIRNEIAFRILSHNSQSCVCRH